LSMSLVITVCVALPSSILYYLKLKQVLAMGEPHSLADRSRQQADSRFHTQSALIGFLSGTVTFSSIMIPLARYPWSHILGIGVGFTGITCWCWMAQHILTTIVPRHLYRYGLEPLVQLNLDDTVRHAQCRLITLITMSLAVLVVVVTQLMERGLTSHSRTRDVVVFMVLPISEYIYLVSVVVYIAMLAQAYRNCTITTHTHRFAGGNDRTKTTAATAAPRLSQPPSHYPRRRHVERMQHHARYPTNGCRSACEVCSSAMRCSGRTGRSLEGIRVSLYRLMHLWDVTQSPDNPLNPAIIVYIGRCTAWAVIIASFGTVITTVLVFMHHEIRPSQAPCTWPMLGEATNFEATRTLFYVFLLATAATAVASAVLVYLKLAQVLSTGQAHSHEDHRRKKINIRQHQVCTTLACLSGILIVVAAMVPSARFPLPRVLGITVGVGGFTYWCWKAHYMILITLPMHLDGYELRGVVGLHLQDTPHHARGRISMLCVMSLMVVLGALAYAASFGLYNGITRDVLLFMVLPLAQYWYLLSLGVYTSLLVWSFRYSTLSTHTPLLMYTICS
jgi:hypothetical protein